MQKAVIDRAGINDYYIDMAKKNKEEIEEVAQQVEEVAPPEVVYPPHTFQIYPRPFYDVEMMREEEPEEPLPPPPPERPLTREQLKINAMQAKIDKQQAKLDAWQREVDEKNAKLLLKREKKKK